MMHKFSDEKLEKKCNKLADEIFALNQKLKDRICELFELDEQAGSEVCECLRDE